MRRMTETQLAEYEALCLASGIDPQIDRLQRRVAIVRERRPPGPRDVPLAIWLRTIAAIVLSWTAGWLAIYWLAVATRPGAQLAPIAVVLLVSTFVVVMYGYRRAWDRAFHAARMAPWPVLVLTAAVALGVLRAPDDGPAQQAADVPDARPTAAPWFPLPAAQLAPPSSAPALPTAQLATRPAPAARVMITPVPLTMPTAVAASVDAAAPLAEALATAQPEVAQAAGQLAIDSAIVVVSGAQDGAELAVQAAGAAQDVAEAVAPVVENVIDVAQTTVDHAQAAGHTAERHQAPAAAGQAGSLAADTGAALAGAAADARQAARRTAEDAVAQPASVAAQAGARLACLLRGGCK